MNDKGGNTMNLNRLQQLRQWYKIDFLTPKETEEYNHMEDTFKLMTTLKALQILQVAQS